MEIRPATRKLRFGHCTLDEGRGVLIAPDGAETLLRPKTFELLRLLLRNPGRVVARDEILDAVWPGVFVTDDSITQCVVELRRAMGEGGTGLLRTVPRRGYLLQAEVIAEAPPAPVVVPPLGQMLSPRADDRPSIAVLPFRMGGPDQQETYYCDGIIEGIVHVLSGLSGIFVVSRGSALAFAQLSTDARAAGRDLGVRYVLYGGVRRAGGRLRITTELSDAERGTILRSDRYDGTETDIFELQDRIAEQVAVTVIPQLREQELARAMRKPPASLTAYDLVLRALDRLHRLDRDTFEEARQLLEQAAELDSAYALARTYRAWWHTLRIAQGWSPDDAADAAAADRLAAEAIGLDAADALALTLRANALAYARHDFDTAAPLLDRAVAISPSCALAWSCGAALRCWTGRGEEALSWAERALRLSPFDGFTFFHQSILAQAQYTVGNYDAAIAFGARATAANPRHAPSWRTMIAAAVALGREAEARELAAHLLEVDRGFSLAAMARRTPLRGALRDEFLARLRRAGLPE
jgi:TolB-like protein/DNA-binding winged helix-turn-helix (wHTH) protein